MHVPSKQALVKVKLESTILVVTCKEKRNAEREREKRAYYLASGQRGLDEPRLPPRLTSAGPVARPVPRRPGTRTLGCMEPRGIEGKAARRR